MAPSACKLSAAICDTRFSFLFFFFFQFLRRNNTLSGVWRSFFSSFVPVPVTFHDTGCYCYCCCCCRRCCLLSQAIFVEKTERKETKKRGIKSTASATIFFCLIVWSAKKNKQKHGRTRNTHFASTTRSLDLPWERLCRRNSAPETREIPRLTVTVARTSVYRESFLATYHYHIRRWSTLCCLTFGNHFLRIRTRTVSYDSASFSLFLIRAFFVCVIVQSKVFMTYMVAIKSFTLINTRESFWTLWKPIRNVFGTSDRLGRENSLRRASVHEDTWQVKSE